ncbi:DNA repair ATPase RecN [Herbaspirillum rubrisubalbicans]|uniref:AAA family ATPase n=1 Tax=Herbaspirillum rubrisubalbicans TaxID=80842 RepID=UPI0020A1BD0D|nr:AAA family ATPase [Herbaspirillum rubrisubalbicans]MCP1576888.1 DNA repair ATPase RecN [Herbaspirillum rubrisubalbicans]
METSPYLIVHKVLVQGFRKTYEATFEEGLNLIWGDMDSGKSSILNLIDYCLGGNNEKLLYGEMKAYGRIAFLEVDLNGNIYTFERDILSSDSYVRIYASSYEGRTSHFPLLVAAASTDKTAPDGWISDFILDCLGIPKVTIKESRNREDASSDRLSFRDLMKLLYLKQTRVGSDNLLDYQQPVVFNKNAEIQKFVFNIYDDRLASLEADLKEALSEANDLERNERSIRKFLTDVKIQPEDFNGEQEKLDQYENDLSALDEGLHQLKQDVLLANDIGRSLADAINALRKEAKSVDEKLEQLDLKYDNFAKLSNTYHFDIDVTCSPRLVR